MVRGKATEKVTKAIKELSSAYLPTKCYLLKGASWEEVSCRELAEGLLNNALENVTLRVCNLRKEVCLDVKDSKGIFPLEVRGVEVYIMLDEGSSIKKGEKLGYIITGKGEGRAVRSPKDGYILLVHEILGEKYDNYVIFIVERTCVVRVGMP